MIPNSTGIVTMESSSEFDNTYLQTLNNAPADIESQTLDVINMDNLLSLSPIRGQQYDEEYNNHNSSEESPLEKSEEVYAVRRRGPGRPVSRRRKKTKKTEDRLMNFRTVDYCLEEEGDVDVDMDEAVNIVPEELCKVEMRAAEEKKPIQSQSLPYFSNSGKRTAIGLKEKMEIVKQLSSGEKQKNLSDKLRIPKSTIQNIWKNRDKITIEAEKLGSERKRCRKAQYEDIETQLIDWFNEMKSSNKLINGPQLRSKAQTISKSLGITEFRASIGWLDKFKNRYKLSFKRSEKSGDRTNNCPPSRTKAVRNFTSKVWPSRSENYAPKDIFSVTETGLFFRTLPSETPTLKDKTCQKGEMSEDRLSLLLSINSDGSEKMKGCVVGNNASDAEIQKIPNISNLPVRWFSNPRSWITFSIFHTWLEEWNDRLEKSKRKILLILNVVHSKRINVTFSNIDILFLPDSETLQPLNHGVVEDFKRHYRIFLLEKLIRKSQSNDPSFPKISVLESLSLISSSWQGISSALSSIGFQKANLRLPITEQVSVGGVLEDDNMMGRTALPSYILFSRGRNAGLHIPDNLTVDEYRSIDENLLAVEPLSCNNIDTGINFQDAANDCFGISQPERGEVLRSIEILRQFIILSPERVNSSIHSALDELQAKVLMPTSAETFIHEVDFSLVDTDVGHFLVLNPNDVSAATANGIITNTSSNSLPEESNSTNFLHVPISIADSSHLITVVMSSEDEVNNSWTTHEAVLHNMDSTQTEHNHLVSMNPALEEDILATISNY